MEFLSRHGVEFEQKDIRSDAAALQELMELGVKSTPTIVVDGEVLIGFDSEKLLALIS